jgi:hypothetical protein
MWRDDPLTAPPPTKPDDPPVEKVGAVPLIPMHLMPRKPLKPSFTVSTENLEKLMYVDNAVAT